MVCVSEIVALQLDVRPDSVIDFSEADRVREIVFASRLVKFIRVRVPVA
jgi:hypothetical protein